MQLVRATKLSVHLFLSAYERETQVVFPAEVSPAWARRWWEAKAKHLVKGPTLLREPDQLSNNSRTLLNVVHIFCIGPQSLHQLLPPVFRVQTDTPFIVDPNSLLG